MENGAGRKRGVKASRSRLDKLMLDAGLKSQASLAEKIAELEGLETPPKDMVNRAFRQLAVDPKSIERIARALGVEAYELYLSSSEPPREPSPEPHLNEANLQSTSRSASANSVWPKWIFALLIGIGLTVFVGYSTKLDTEPEASGVLSSEPLSALTFAIVPNGTGITIDLEKALLQSLKSTSKVVEHWTSHQTQGTDLLDLPDVLNADFVVTSKADTSERHTKLVYYLVGRQQRHVLFIDVLLSASVPTIATKLASEVHKAIEKVLSGQQYSLNPGMTSNEQAAEQFLLGQQYLNRENTDANLQRALVRFERALRLDPNFGRAQGALCETLLRQGSASGDTKLVEEARPICELALTLGEFEESLYGMTSLKRRDRDWTKAQEYIDRLLEVNPGFTDALFSKLKILETRGQLERNPELFKQGIEVANEGIALEPASWRGYFLKSRLLYFSGDASGAIDALETSKQKQANFNNLNNLGTMYFCMGDLNAAKDNFLAILDLQSDPSWVVEHQLASLYSFLGDGDNAIKYADRGMTRLSIEEIDGHFDPWITKAIAYDTKGDIQTAESSFAKALEIAERFRVNGTDEGNTLAQLIYIKTAIAYLETKQITEQQKSELVLQLTDAAAGATNPNAITRVMMAWVMLGELQRAKPIYDRMGAMCPGFVKQPILAPLKSL